MTKERQDAWSSQDDSLLAETVLKHIRGGSTQLNAFEEVGDQLNRTSAACGFRWNAEVRQNYEKAVDQAKRERKELKRAQIKAQRLTPSHDLKHTFVEAESKLTDSVDIDQIIQSLTQLKQMLHVEAKGKESIQSLTEKHQLLIEENEKLKKQVDSLTEQLETVQEDYQTFIKIMDRARKMVVFNDPSELPSFSMDKNGNLEPITPQSL
ncbi:prespore-specific regulator [Pelagirhabdus alkalitolerans]|uniref:Prespore-specific regulator n=1 Tax=Pelagirhabdus alkalitolerans TaxID=1612202 RepID=A0A1G6HS16_9BACI|nr:RsfA family transcriptional regulator [Pelagirhabdus alkalitolerans]SDB96974.1 prespore-specific regulator [Pelagirhabdus alkalitolerans]